MKHILFAIALYLSFLTPAQADLEEKVWRDMPDAFQLGYLWGMLEATTAKPWEHRPDNPKYSTEVNALIRKSFDKFIATCIETKELSPFQLQIMLDEFMRQHPPESGESIYVIVRRLIGRTCFP